MLIDILVPTAILTGIGVIAGLMLALAARFIKQKSNEVLLQIREALPGFNCGACGYPGCDPYAKAIFEDGARIDLCRPGRKETLNKLEEATKNLPK